jgi:hypothetical protein
MSTALHVEGFNICTAYSTRTESNDHFKSYMHDMPRMLARKSNIRLDYPKTYPQSQRTFSSSYMVRSRPCALPAPFHNTDF